MVRTYAEALEFLFGRINYERIHAGDYRTSDFKLDRMRQLLSLLGDPQERLPAIHIAGTKGKGSTAVMTAEILSAAGYRTGLFTSPHRTRFEERMRVDGAPPTEAEFVELFNHVFAAVETMDRLPGRMRPTYFELSAALAWRMFEQRGVDFAVLEVGLGGRLDATNLCRPAATIITSISRDHMALLGETTGEIAREKAGIIKPRVPVISGAIEDNPARVIHEISRQHDAPLFELNREIQIHRHSTARAENDVPGTAARFSRLDFAGMPPVSPEFDVSTPWRTARGLRVPLAGEHQLHNAALAVAAVDAVHASGRPIPPEAVVNGLAAARCPLRIEVVHRDPLVIVDAAHNDGSIHALLQTLGPNDDARQRILIFGASKDKQIGEMLQMLLPEFDTVILTQYLNNPRAVPVHELHKLAAAISGRDFAVTETPAAAWNMSRALAVPGDMICGTGSFFVAAELREVIIGERASESAPALTTALPAAPLS